MKSFELIDARSAREAADLLKTYGKRAKLFATGADLLYMMKDWIEGPAVPYPEVLVNLATVRELEGISFDPKKGLTIGAMTRLINLIEHPLIQSQYSLLVQAASKVASPQLRHTSTIAGNLCQRPRCSYFRQPDIVCLKKGGSTCWAIEGDNRYYHAIFEGGPCHIVHPSDMAPALIALNASINILGRDGLPRTIPLESFFVTTERLLYQENILADDEVITEIIVPPPKPNTKQVFLKATVRQADEFALVAVALLAQLEGATCIDCRIVLGGVSPRPLRSIAAEETVRGRRLTEAVTLEAAAATVSNAKPMSMNAYKVDLTRGLVKQAFEQAIRS
jgi:xanthine dehydrogenase YagS FAD-binding subunit